jgi:uncharacterized membrane protein
MTAAIGATRPPARSVTAPGILLGVGLGGFVDGILLHQVLQWHHMGVARSTSQMPSTAANASAITP